MSHVLTITLSRSADATTVLDKLTEPEEDGKLEGEISVHRERRNIAGDRLADWDNEDEEDE